jgi:hypothetical protein
MATSGYSINIKSEEQIRFQISPLRRLMYAILSLILAVSFGFVLFNPAVPKAAAGIIFFSLILLLCMAVAGLNRYLDLNKKEDTAKYGISLFGIKLRFKKYSLDQLSQIQLVQVTYNYGEAQDSASSSGAGGFMATFLPGRTSARPYDKYAKLAVYFGEERLALEDSKHYEVLEQHAKLISQFLNLPLEKEQI